MIWKEKLPSAIDRFDRVVPSNAPSPSSERVAGRQIDDSDEHNQNAYSSIRESLQPASNVTLESPSHQQKQCSQTTSTDHGTQIERSDEQNSNAYRSIRESFEPASNATLKSL
jgi:hypothetical protein